MSSATAITFFIFQGLLIVSAGLRAVQPLPPPITIATQVSPGKIIVILRNQDTRPADVLVQTGPLSTVRLAPFKVTLAAGETKTIPVAATMAPGRQALGLETTVTFPGRGEIRGHALYEALRVDGQEDRGRLLGPPRHSR